MEKMENLTLNEQINTNGGGLWIPALMLLGAMINDAQNNPEDFEAGFDAAPNPYDS